MCQWNHRVLPCQRSPHVFCASGVRSLSYQRSPFVLCVSGLRAPFPASGVCAPSVLAESARLLCQRGSLPFLPTKSVHPVCQRTPRTLPCQQSLRAFCASGLCAPSVPAESAPFPAS
ncbi:hypothetical protein ACLB2K_038039 [Fragaria x ananassa]